MAALWMSFIGLGISVSSLLFFFFGELRCTQIVPLPDAPTARIWPVH